VGKEPACLLGQPFHIHLKSLPTTPYASGFPVKQWSSDSLYASILWASTKNGFTLSNIQGKLKRTRLGKRILCSDNLNWSTQEIIFASWAQNYVEDAFKQMKDPH